MELPDKKLTADKNGRKRISLIIFANNEPEKIKNK